MRPARAVQPLLKVENLSVAYRNGNAWQNAVREVTLQIETGQTYGLVGESGSGKTTLAMAVMRYLGQAGQVGKGRILFEGRDLLNLSQAEMRQIWGTQIGLVPQDPLSSLNPAIRVGEQLAETLRHQQGLDRQAANARVEQLLRMVRLPDPQQVTQSYPHQISGGMQQRVLIAMALSLHPRLLILDEPTTSLDVTTQAAILDLIRDLIQGLQTGVLYVTHNLGVVAQICDRVAVLYAGELVEDAPVADLFERPLHPYTLGLLASVPRLGENKDQASLQAIPGQIPPLGARPSGCVFAPRCPLAIEICQERPPLYAPAAGRRTRCHRWEELTSGDAELYRSAEGDDFSPSPSGDTRPGMVLETQDLAVHFPIRRSWRQVLAGKPARVVKAVDGVSLSVPVGKTLGLVGESGSGKTTLSRAIMGLIRRTSGEVELLGLPLPPRLSKRSLDTLRHLQMVFQNPEEALNPYMSVGSALRRPLVSLRRMSSRAARVEVERLLEAVRLPSSFADRMPGQLSGGEKQRVAIARAFATQPDLLVADEPVSSLDVSVQAFILNLLAQLQVEQGTSMLFISHDLAVVGYLADVIAVIYLGHLMEVADAPALFELPHHPYTEALLSAIPAIDDNVRREHIRLEGDIPSPANAPSGCPFHTRCPRFLGEICVEQTPPWQVDPESGKRYFCHIPPEELRHMQAQAAPVEDRN